MAPTVIASKNLVLSGKPGVGKTTLVKEAAWPFRARLGGFFTEEILEGRLRLGFKIRSFDGEEGLLASKTLVTPTRLNKYGIDLDALERVGVGAVRRALAGREIIVIDEIGAMETMSPAFRELVLACFTGDKPVLATIRHGAHHFAEELTSLPETEVLELSRENYRDVHDRVRRWVELQLTANDAAKEDDGQE